MTRGSRRRAEKAKARKAKDPLAWLRADIAAKSKERDLCAALYRRLSDHVKAAIQRLEDRQLELGIIPDVKLGPAPESPQGGDASPEAKFK